MARMSDRFPTVPVVSTTACFVLVTAFIVVLPGCRHTEDGADTTSQRSREAGTPDTLRVNPPGCLKLRVAAEGSERDSLRTWLPTGSLPSIVELDTTRAESAGSDSVYQAYSWFDQRRESHPFSVWRHAEDGGIRLQRAGALSGTLLDLYPDQGKLSGTVAVYSDTGVRGRQNRREGAVEAVPAQCPDV